MKKTFDVLLDAGVLKSQARAKYLFTDSFPDALQKEVKEECPGALSSTTPTSPFSTSAESMDGRRRNYPSTRSGRGSVGS